MKRIVSLYLDATAIEILKDRKVNLSSFINNLILAEAELNPTEEKDERIKLRLEIGKLQESLRKRNEESRKREKEHQKEVEDLKDQIPQLTPIKRWVDDDEI